MRTSGQVVSAFLLLMRSKINPRKGGITNGQEMVAAYMRETLRGPATEAALAMADVGERGIEYTKSKTVDTVWWLCQIIKALTVGNGKRK